MTPELTIFEGPPGCGQGALATRLLQALPSGWICHHGPYAEDGPVRLLDRYLRPMRSELTDALLYDRSWLSEAVFGPIGCDTDRLGVAGRRYLERVALSRRGIVVVPFTPLEDCRRRRPPVSEEAEATLRLAYEGFVFVQTLTALPVVYVSADAHIRNLWNELIRLRPPENKGPGIGHWKPHAVTLLVGEAPSETSDPRMPFVEPNLKLNNCSAWLAGQLEAGGIREDALYWINAQDRDRRWTDPEFLDALKPRRVVALGDAAERWCGVVARVEHRTAPHPQQWRRFHAGRPYPLIDLLKEKTP